MYIKLKCASTISAIAPLPCATKFRVKEKWEVWASVHVSCWSNIEVNTVNCSYSLSHSPTGGDASHDDTLWSWGGHSLESPFPKLLKELLLFQLEGGSASLRSQGQRGATGTKLEWTWGLHFCFFAPNWITFSHSPDSLPSLSYKRARTRYWLLLRNCPSTESNRAECSRCFAPSSLLTAAGQCVSASVCSSLLSGSVQRRTKADPLLLETGYCSPRWGGVREIVFLSPPLLFCHICCSLGWGLGRVWKPERSFFSPFRQLHTKLGIPWQ